MSNAVPDGTQKVHPATREILPEDPMEMRGFEVPGDPDLMLRLLVEEYARMGWGSAAIMQLARDPNYAVFHGLLAFLGEEELLRRVSAVISRCGVMRVKQEVQPAEPPPGPFVQLDMSQPSGDA
ncbi:MAG: hypothetical protein GY903_31305 [Fuerstiella sp.]|nr:hypothetical protein [Fuerstiella sp.]MCP4858981.1 hypothetical protein [Fuerstiella sp.]